MTADLVHAISKDLFWNDRKRLITALTSAHWAGTITRENNDQVSLSRRNLVRSITDHRVAIKTITRRLALPVMTKEERRAAHLSTKKAGYETRGEVAGKKYRLEILRLRLAEEEAALVSGHFSICRGGKRLLNTRYNLVEAKMSEAMWRRTWVAKRRFIAANGESGKLHGNETIRVSPEDGTVTIDLPAALAHLANSRQRGTTRYVLESKAIFHDREDEWKKMAIAGKAIGYRIWEDPDKDRWYIEASWSTGKIDTDVVAVVRSNGTDDVTPASLLLPMPTAISASVTPLSALSASPIASPTVSPAVSATHTSAAVTCGIDLNADHLACALLDASGNVVGAPFRVDLALAGLSASTRDGHIRAAISTVIGVCRTNVVRRIAVEDLDFSDGKGRENHGHNKRFRNVIAGFPTTIFKARLVAMTARNGITLVAVDPAYTSRWGAEHWLPALHTPDHVATSHEAASVVIGRRATGYGARRRRNRVSEQRIADLSSRVSRASHPVSRGLLVLVRQRGGTRVVRQTLTGSRDTIRSTRDEHRLRPPLTFIPSGSEETGVRFVRFQKNGMV